jgi:hypothetical protein
MAGHAIRSGQLMERRVIGLSDRAIDEAARGLHATEAQVELGRAVDRMYGQYQKFSPAKRETLLHTTPFYPWYRNVLTFLTKVLPVDHPVKAALLADMSAVEEDWRKSHGLSTLHSIRSRRRTSPASRRSAASPASPATTSARRARVPCSTARACRRRCVAKSTRS